MLAFKPLNVYLYHLIYAILMKKQSKTLLFGSLRKAFQMAMAAEKRQTDALEIVQRDEEARRSRRRFLANTGKAALLGAGLPTLTIP